MFRHLAERVVGHRGGRIHAAVRLPFRDAPPLDPEVPVDHGTPSIPSVSVRADARGRPAAPSPGEQHGESPIVAAVAHPRPAADRVPEATRTPGREQSATVDEVAGKDARDIDGDSDSRATPRVPGTTRRAVAPGECPQPDRHVAAPIPRTVGESVTTTASRESGRMPVDSTHPSSGPAAETIATASRNAEPGALLPPVTPHGAQPSPPSLRRRESAADPRHDERSQPNEVHVHIGRVEVTAVQEAPAPRRAAARKGREPMSLDTYLEQRRRDRT